MTPAGTTGSPRPHDRLQDVLRRLEGTLPGRCLASFAAIRGVDRSMVIASQAFTALIPLLIIVSALAPTGDRDAVGDLLIRKFELDGSSAEAVQQVFTRPAGASTGVLSLVLLLFSGVSLTRRVQRLYLDAWRVPPRPGPRATLNAALGLAALLVEVALLYLARSLIRELPLERLLGTPASFLGGAVLWTGIPWLLLDRRVSWRRLLPGGLLTALATAAFGAATTVYMPHQMEAYSARYGLFGVTLAIVGWLVCVSFLVVTVTVLAAELDRAPEPWVRRLRARLGIEPGQSGSSGRDEVVEREARP